MSRILCRNGLLINFLFQKKIFLVYTRNLLLKIFFFRKILLVYTRIYYYDFFLLAQRILLARLLTRLFFCGEIHLLTRGLCRAGLVMKFLISEKIFLVYTRNFVLQQLLLLTRGFCCWKFSLFRKILLVYTRSLY